MTTTPPSHTSARRASCVATVLGVTLLAYVATGVSLGAAGGQASKPKKGAAVPVATLAWPTPPEPTRVRYVSAYRGSSDFKTKKPGRWKTALLGKAPDTDPADTFVKPYAVAVSPSGLIYVSDTAARRVFVIDADKQTMSFVGDQGNITVVKPVGVAVDAAGTVFVGDATLKRVLGFAPDGSLTMAIGRDGEFDSPAGLAIDRARNLLYVVDSSRHQIPVYSTTTGEHLRTIGRRGSENGELNFPTNAAVDGDGRLYVADTLNFRVQVFDADGMFVHAFGQPGDSPGSFNRPKGIAVDSEGHIYVADTAFNNFQIFDNEGRLLLDIGRGGPGAGQFLLPAGLYIDHRDQIFVADQGNSRVQVFQYVRASSQAQPARSTPPGVAVRQPVVQSTGGSQ